MYIEELEVNGVKYENVPAEIEGLTALGLSDAGAKQKVNELLLQNKKIALRAAINKARDKRIDAGVEFPTGSGDWFDSDDTSQKNINGAVTMFSIAAQSGQGDSYEQPWIKLDGNVTVLNGQGVVGLGVTLGRHVGKHRIEAAGFKKQLEEAADIDAANAIFEAYKATA